MNTKNKAKLLATALCGMLISATSWAAIPDDGTVVVNLPGQGNISVTMAKGAVANRAPATLKVIKFNNALYIATPSGNLFKVAAENIQKGQIPAAIQASDLPAQTKAMINLELVKQQARDKAALLKNKLQQQGVTNLQMQQLKEKWQTGVQQLQNRMQEMRVKLQDMQNKMQDMQKNTAPKAPEKR